MNGKLQMKVVLITGASNGIGAATASLLASQGYHVIINYNLSQSNALALQKELINKGFSASVFKADVSNPNQVKSMIDSIVNDYGKIDFLVNNAGISQSKIVCDISNEDWDKMIGTNLSGTFYCCREVLKDMLKRHYGSIVNISSIWGEIGASCEVHYSAAKAGVIGLTKALAKEYAPSNIRINCVSPGLIDTKMNSSYSKEDLESFIKEIPVQRIGTVNDIASTISFLLSDDARYITGQVLPVNGGLN